MRASILARLENLADHHNIRILFACETGSRGWGFASPDSDYDVRFVFAHTADKYLAINDPKDGFTQMLETEGEILDLNGWDLRKTLSLFLRSNATPFEWLQSPIIYAEQSGFRDELWALAPQYAQARKLIHHYLGICRSSMNSGISEGQINIKKYFYVLRPLLAAIWAADNRTAPPMEFAPLLAQLAGRPQLLRAIQQLWAEKEKALEGAMTLLVPEIQDFIEAEMQRCNAVAATLESNFDPDPAQLNAFFRKWIQWT